MQISCNYKHLLLLWSLRDLPLSHPSVIIEHQTGFCVIYQLLTSYLFYKPQYVCVCIYIYIHILCVCIYIYTFIYMCVCVCVHVCVYVSTDEWIKKMW